MLLYHESGIAYTRNWVWASNGQYPILSFGKFVFANRFHISRNGVKLVEGTDYRRVLKSKEVALKFGEDIFGGVVLLTTQSEKLDVYAVDSSLSQETLPSSTTDPQSVSEFSSINPMDGSYQDVLNMIDELTNIIPYIRGISLPTYVSMSLGEYIPRVNGTPDLKMNFLPTDLINVGDTGVTDNPGRSRSDFIGGVDNIPLDY